MGAGGRCQKSESLVLKGWTDMAAGGRIRIRLFVCPSGFEGDMETSLQ